MKNYYVTCTVRYIDAVIDDSYNGSENYDFIIEAKNKKEAKEQAKEQALEEFNETLNMDFTDITVKVDDCYITTDDARCD